MDKFTLYNDDCLNVLRTMEDNSIDSCVTDPPYGLSFMGKAWDYDVPKKEIWEEVFRVLKPGGHVLAFFGSRTYHRGVIQIEDAGFEIRDQIMWLYGSGFPKSHNIGKAIDATLTLGSSHSTAIKSATENRPGEGYEVGTLPNNGIASQNRKGGYTNDNPSTEEASQWSGWGTALKPAHEPIVVARKPITQTVAKNVLEHGTGAINIDGCRAGVDAGRWPANVIHDGSDEVVSRFPNESSRFFYCAKASKSDKDEGLDCFLAKKVVSWQTGNGASGKPSSLSAGRDTEYKNIHPTVKPTELMKYLCRLVTPKDGIVLDPFMGSGTTGKAAAQEGFKFIGIEMSSEYFEIAQARIEHAYEGKTVSLEEFFT